MAKQIRFSPAFRTLSYPVGNIIFVYSSVQGEADTSNIERIKCMEDFLSSLDANRKLILQRKRPECQKLILQKDNQAQNAASSSVQLQFSIYIQIGFK